MRLMSFFFYAVLLFRAPSWSGLSGKMIELSARPHVPSVIASWNILEFAHFNHTERTTETKKEKLYKDSQVKNQRYRIDNTSHFLCLPLFTMIFFHTCTTSALSLSLSSNCLSLSLWQFVSFPQHSLCTAGLVVTIEIAKGFRVTLVEVCTETFVFFFFCFFSLCKQAHTNF